MVVVITIRSFLGQIFNQGYQLWCKFKPDEDINLFVFLNKKATLGLSNSVGNQVKLKTLLLTC